MCYFGFDGTKNVHRDGGDRLDEDSLMALLVPEMMEQAAERYELLRQIALTQPVGRRLLAVQSKLTERVVRGHVEAMERSGLVTIQAVGIRLTPKGEQVLAPLSRYFMKRPSFAEQERQLTEILSMKQVILVRGDMDQNPAVKQSVGQEAALALARRLRNGQILAVSGGTTMAALVAALPRLSLDVTVVPARGGFGEKIEYQANTVAAVTAEKIGGTYRMLHIPDGFSSALIDRLREESPDLVEIESLIHRADILAIGVGEANRMAQRHQLESGRKNRLMTEGACGEALGLYADIRGRVLDRMNNVGIALEELRSIPHVIIAAGGASKGAAILAMARAGVRGTLVTDEGAGKEILAIAREEQRH